VAVRLNDGTAQVPSVVSLPFFLAAWHHVHKSTVLFPWLQIIEHLKTESLTYLHRADSWVLGPLFLQHVKRGRSRKAYIKQFVFGVPKSHGRGGDGTYTENYLTH
jgi:hypothetical protein